MNILIYRMFFALMMIGFAGLSIQAPDLKGKLIGVVLLIANWLIFYRQT